MERTAFSKFTNNPSDPVLLDEDDSDFVHTIPKKISISKSNVSKKKVSGIPVVPLNISYEQRTKFKSDRPHKNVVVQYEDDPRSSSSPIVLASTSPVKVKKSKPDARGRVPREKGVSAKVIQDNIILKVRTSPKPLFDLIHSLSEPQKAYLRLGLTQEFDDAMNENVENIRTSETPVTVIPSPIRLSSVQTIPTPLDPNRRIKRNATKPLTSRSPFVMRAVSISGGITAIERSTSDCIFSLIRDPEYYLSFLKEEVRAPESPQRLFCLVTLTNAYLENMQLKEEHRREIFRNSLISCIEDTDHLLRTIQIVSYTLTV
ncbi:hypothetical protein L1887_19678 [Cichorium endivia]|nr:hypothetical protein L1887_19678 [Cichorium endivia]